MPQRRTAPANTFGDTASTVRRATTSPHCCKHITQCLQFTQNAPVLSKHRRSWHHRRHVNTADTAVWAIHATVRAMNADIQLATPVYAVRSSAWARHWHRRDIDSVTCTHRHRQQRRKNIYANPRPTSPKPPFLTTSIIINTADRYRAKLLFLLCRRRR